MSASQIVGLGLRLFAVSLVLYVFGNAPAIWEFNLSAWVSSANLAVVIVSILLLVIAVALWFFPLTIAKALLPGRSVNIEGLGPPQITFEQLQALAFSLLGLWILAGAIPKVFYWILMAYHASRPELLLEFRPRDFGSMVATGTEAVLGIWLLFGAKGLRGLLRWAREART
jgi:hypothetical protein